MKKKILSGLVVTFFIFFFVLFSFTLSATFVSAATIRYVTTGGSNSGNCSSSPCKTITYAISQSVSGDTISVDAGTYDEQVVIDKSLTLQGAGEATLVKPSSAAKLTQVFDGLFWYGTPNTKNISGIIVANVADGSSVIVKDLKVDESGVTTKPAGANFLAGIFYRETGGTINKVNITGGGAWSGYDRAYGIYLSAATNTVTVEIKISMITNYDKNGIEAMGNRLTFNINNNVITGRGLTLLGDEVQNGINAGRGSKGTITFNRISDLAYQPEDWWSFAILFGDSDGTAEDNTIKNCQMGIVFQDGSGTAKDNKIDGETVGLVGLWAQYTKAGVWTVSFEDNTVNNLKDSISTAYWVNPDTAAIGAQSWNSGSSLTINIKENKLNGDELTNADGVYIGDILLYNETHDLYSSPAGSIAASITDNEISGWDYGIHFVSSIASATIIGNTISDNHGTSSGIHIESAINATKVIANFNKITGNLNYGVYNNGTGSLNAKNNWWGSSSGPGPIGNGTGDKVSTNVDYDPWLKIILNVSSPEEEKAYEGKIFINVSTGITVDKIQYSLDGKGFRDFCKNCDKYENYKMFTDGDHTLRINATLGSETASKLIRFFVDSDEPDIKKTLPEDGAIVHGTNFYIKYSEDNLRNITLNWKESTAGTYNKVLVAGCVNGTNKECSTSVDLNAYDGKFINYSFNVSDPVRSVASEVKTIKIDNSIPNITITSPANTTYYSDRRIVLNVSVNETVADLEYTLDDGNSRSLCSDCNGYDRRTTFSDGYHKLTVNATDYAGNVGQATIYFTVDSKPPKIDDQLPDDKKYTNGTFTVQYTESDLQNITLYYKGASEPDTSYKNLTNYTCLSGKDQECNFYVNLSTYNNGQINYYFVVRNHVSETASDVYLETVDTTVPAFTISSPTPGPHYDRRLRLNIIGLNEKVRLEYSDSFDSFRKLCSSCMTYDSTKTFSVGAHTLQLRATDVANNVVTKTLLFTIA